jgi:ribose transport system permease protein
MEKHNQLNKNWLTVHLTDVAAYGGLLLCLLIFTIIPPIFGESLWTASKISTLISDVIVTALMSVGAVFVYALGNMDVSIGRQVGIYATLMVLVGNVTGSLLPGILLCLIASVLIAVVNGATGEVLHIHPIIPSVVLMMMFSGLSTIIYTKIGSRSISLTKIDYSIFKQSWLMVVVLILEILIITYLFNATKFGKYAKAIGANPRVAVQSGISIVKYKVISYIIMGICIVIASIFQMGYTGSASDSTGIGFEMNVMVALILGGMPLSGAMKSKVSCAVIGAFTYSLLDVGLPLIGVAANTVFIIKAFIFLLVVLITCRKPKGVLPR